MTATELIEKLSKYDRILVSGCQRSGTTAISQMLAADLAYQLVDEDDFGVHDERRFVEQLRRTKIVVQCPALSHLLHLIRAPDALLIWMRRPLDQIRRSMERLEWWVPYEEPREKEKYRRTFAEVYEYDASRPIEEIKYELWENFQQEKLTLPWLELDYDCEYMRNHEMYVPSTRRKEFDFKQTRPGEESSE